MKNYKKTKSVKLIADFFNCSNQALSVVDLVKKFKENMNKTTVYRILDRLEDNEILHSFTGKDGLKWYAKCDQNNSRQKGAHPHFQCEVCGKSECLHIGYIMPQLPNYKITSTNILITGQCDDCIL